MNILELTGQCLAFITTHIVTGPLDQNVEQDESLPKNNSGTFRDL